MFDVMATIQQMYVSDNLLISKSIITTYDK